MMADSGERPQLQQQEMKPAATNRNCFGTLYYNPQDLEALKVVAASNLLHIVLHLEEVKDVSAPVLFVQSGSGRTLQDPFAIVWLMATSLEGSRYHHHHPMMTLKVRSSLLQWHFFCQSELKPFISGLMIPALGSPPAATRDARFRHKQRQERLAKSLDVLNSTLRPTGGGSGKSLAKKFLASDRLSLADFCVAAAILPILTSHSPALSEVWTRKNLTYLKHWLSVTVMGSTPFLNAAKLFPNLHLQQVNQVDLNANSVVKGCEAVDGGVVSAEAHHRQPKAAKNGRTNGWKRRAAGGDPKAGPKINRELPLLPSKPFRILCLHGYRQNGNIFKDKLGAFRNITGKYLDFTFITAPNHVLPLSADDLNQDQRGWWFSRDSDYFQAKDSTDCDKGFEQSLATIVEAFELHGPFHGLMGFSQGAALVALLCLLKARQPDFFSDKVTFQFAIMVSAFRSRSSRHAEFFDQTNPLFKKVQIPTLHIMGNSDRVIDRNMSEEILAFFEKPSVMHHSGAHFVPASSKQKMGFLGFLSKVYETVKPDQGKEVELDEEGIKGSKPEPEKIHENGPDDEVEAFKDNKAGGDAGPGNDETVDNLGKAGGESCNSLEPIPEEARDE